ncbi:multidrug effflux MFS transporter [Aureivirga sp. CE67]|uniref:multidrug effflux MFS transporter n=1 Tax=Aureivirga sp. CE67 TaxID=1788983 RepID=UPI0018CB171A|nr:multidrug effflux MFS transporter [Aureivirga sp. CE67]
MENTNTNKVNIEFVAMMASLMSIVALSIDALLPALSEIGLAIHTTDNADNQLLVTMIFLGLGFGQLLFGPLSDSFGRKPIIYIGFSLYTLASFLCVAADSLDLMIIGRILQGIGLAAPYTLCISIVRDSYKGDFLARVMSFVTVIFILVPIIAPSLGKIILNYFDWKAIFYFQILFGIVILFWFWKRQPETLKPEFKRNFNLKIYKHGIREFFKFRETVGFTLISGFITGSFMTYISSSQHIFENQYGLKDEFPFVFAGMALTVGISTFTNGMLVMKLGMHKLALIALAMFSILPIIYLISFSDSGNPSLIILIAFMVLQFLAIGFLFGNIRAISMQPIGHIAGIGAAINGFISTIVAVPIGVILGRYIDITVYPLFIGFAICGILSFITFFIARKPKEIEA